MPKHEPEVENKRPKTEHEKLFESLEGYTANDAAQDAMWLWYTPFDEWLDKTKIVWTAGGKPKTFADASKEEVIHLAFILSKALASQLVGAPAINLEVPDGWKL